MVACMWPDRFNVFTLTLSLYVSPQTYKTAKPCTNQLSNSVQMQFSLFGHVLALGCLTGFFMSENNGGQHFYFNDKALQDSDMCFLLWNIAIDVLLGATYFCQFMSIQVHFSPGLILLMISDLFACRMVVNGFSKVNFYFYSCMLWKYVQFLFSTLDR